jgi:flagellar biosynthesis anti-sigma factor FlgM
MKTSNKPPEDQGPDRQKPKRTQNFPNRNSPEQRDEPQQISPVPTDFISDQKKEIADIVAAIHRLPETREHLILKIKKALDSGTYIVNSRKVAERILKDL